MVVTPELVLGIIRATIYVLIAICGLVGAAQVATTREDAFEAAGRQQKWMWCAILAGSAAAIMFRFPLLDWIGIVAIGVYFFDVRPQIKDILAGNYRW
ncbi:hypothetical protein CKALI_10620 [Corynebacterium kalinowskii]|uniref:DUF2516 domain-containing protein n=1 Tax=Corynebacterium kalinowskii TaxID=2675216 RepID=A0A6B8VVM5_9CORY|nr:DUF2516 family protein [Corynebacterium kalinowskii]QGU02975.1 hypothetical protein CKALI_10620 [Corynebacterium kalinowskii]